LVFAIAATFGLGVHIFSLGDSSFTDAQLIGNVP
jgi:hypothetical protein